MGNRTYAVKNPESNKEYIFCLDLVKRIGNAPKKFIPLCILRKQNINITSIVERHPKTFVQIGKRIYLRTYIDEHVKVYGKAPEVAKRGRRRKEEQSTLGTTEASYRPLLYVQRDTVEGEYSS